MDSALDDCILGSIVQRVKHYLVRRTNFFFIKNSTLQNGAER